MKGTWHMIITIQVTDTQQQTITVHYSHGALQSSVSVPVLCLMSGMIMWVVLMPREVRTHWHQPGGTHRHWTQPPQSQLYTHNYNWFNRYISVWDIFNHKILQSEMFEPAKFYSIVDFSILALMGAQEVMCVCLPQTCAYCSSFWFRFQADFKWT